MLPSTLYLPFSLAQNEINSFQVFIKNLEAYDTAGKKKKRDGNKHLGWHSPFAKYEKKKKAGGVECFLTIVEEKEAGCGEWGGWVSW